DLVEGRVLPRRSQGAAARVAGLDRAEDSRRAGELRRPRQAGEVHGQLGRDLPRAVPVVFAFEPTSAVIPAEPREARREPGPTAPLAQAVPWVPGLAEPVIGPRFARTRCLARDDS